MSNDEWVDTCGLDVDDPAFAQLSDEWEAKTQAFCSGARDPRELHVFVDTFNWDQGTDDLAAILQNPVCEAATALMIYWRASPEFYLDHPPAADEPIPEELALIRSIEHRYANGAFQRGICSYDPVEDRMVIRPEQRRLPQIMYKPVVRSDDTAA
ncbi:MAG: DUF4274 domain-containing protein [Pseudomonadota bacterium]